MITESEFLKKIKQLVLKREYNTLKYVFSEHLTSCPLSQALPEIWISIEYLVRPTIALNEYASDLSMLIAQHLLEQGHNKEALGHIRKVGHLLIADRAFRQKIIQVYKNQYPDLENLDTLIRLSALDEADLSQAIKKLDKLISLKIGTPVYSSRFGYGEVTKLDFLLSLLTVNFFSNHEHSISIEQAINTLQPLPFDNFHYLKAKNPARISEMLKQNPQELFEIIKRDTEFELKPAHIKQFLSDIADKNDIALFVKICRTNQKPLNRAAIQRITNHTFVNLKELKNQSDWQDKYIELFFKETNKKLLLSILFALDETKQKEIVNKVFIEYKQYPDQFLLISQTAPYCSLLAPHSLLTRYLDLIDLKKYTVNIRKQLFARNYELLKSALVQITEQQARRIFASIQAIRNLYPEQLDDIRKIFQEKFPEMFSKPGEFVYHTETAIKNKSKELQRLVSEEIPKIAAEIGHARSYGDLRENFEFKAAKEKQKRLLSKCSQMRHDLAVARPIDFNKIDVSKVQVGTTIKLVDKEDDSRFLTYTILGPWDSDVSKGVISYLAPFALNLLNKKVGDEVTDTEGKTYEIVEISLSKIT